MRVLYRCLRRALPVYEQLAVTFCCASMKCQWGRLIGFGTRDVSASTSRDVSIFLDHPQANGRMILELLPIRHCPFCGEAIEKVRMRQGQARIVRRAEYS